jgi:hypothetical protein
MADPAPLPVLLGVMFDSNPELAVPLETYFPVEPKPVWLDPQGTLQADRVVEAFQKKQWFRKLPLSPGSFGAEVHAAGPVTYPDVIRCFFRVYAEAQGKPRCGNKTPRHVIYIPQLARMFPEARFIHIVRDGRDVGLSLLDVDDDMPDLHAAARFWRDRVTKARADGETLGTARYIEVRYEDLLDDPEGELRRLCSFVDLPYDEAMLRYYERIPTMVIGAGEHRKLSKPPTKGLRDWRTVLSADEAVAFDAIAGDALASFGYERSSVRATRVARLRVRAKDGALDVRRNLSSIRRRPNASKARHG